MALIDSGKTYSECGLQLLIKVQMKGGMVEERLIYLLFSWPSLLPYSKFTLLLLLLLIPLLI